MNHGIVDKMKTVAYFFVKVKRNKKYKQKDNSYLNLQYGSLVPLRSIDKRFFPSTRTMFTFVALDCWLSLEKTFLACSFGDFVPKVGESKEQVKDDDATFANGLTISLFDVNFNSIEIWKSLIFLGGNFGEKVVLHLAKIVRLSNFRQS